MMNPEEERTSPTNLVPTERQLRQQLSNLKRGGGLSADELACVGELSGLFNQPGNPLQKPISREAFETALKWMSNLDDHLVAPFVDKLLGAGLIEGINTGSKEISISLPRVVLEHAEDIVRELTAHS